MAVSVKGRRVALPWNDDFDKLLMRVGEQTYEHSGEDLLHEIHKQAIENTLINVRLYRNLAKRLAWIIGLQTAMLAFLLLRFGI